MSAAATAARLVFVCMLVSESWFRSGRPWRTGPLQCQLMASVLKDVVRIDERASLRCRDWRRQRPEFGGAVGIDVPPQQHRVVLVHRVMAMLHVGAGEVAELHAERHRAGRLQAVDVL